MKLFLAPILILIIIASTFIYLNYGVNDLNNTEVSESQSGVITNESKETIPEETKPIKEAIATNTTVKEIPEWLKKYQNLPKDQQIDSLMMALKEVENLYDEKDELANNLELFSEIYKTNRSENALKLIDDNYGDLVLKNGDKFNISDSKLQSEILQKLESKGQLYWVAQNFNFFKTTTDQEIEIFEKIFNKHPNDAIENFEKFKKIPKSNHYKYAQKTIDKDKENLKVGYYSAFSCLLFENIHKFDNLSELQKLELYRRTYDNKIACGREIADNFEKWNIKSLEYRMEIASKIIMEGYSGFLVDNLKKFNFNSEQQLFIAQRLADAKSDFDFIEENINNFNPDIRNQVLQKIKN